MALRRVQQLLQRRIEGPDVKGKRVLAVEDTSTTGGSVLTAVEALKEAGAIVVGIAAIVGAQVGHLFGATYGRKLFDRPDGRFFNQYTV